MPDRGRGGTQQQVAADLGDLYREVILDHFRAPRHKGKVENPDIASTGLNPLCGDELQLTVAIRDGHVSGLGILPTGCSISQASASMMAEALAGQPVARLEWLASQFKNLMLSPNGKAEKLPAELEELEALEGVRKYPARVKCAVLAWNTLLEGLKEYRMKGYHPAVARHQEE